MKFAPIAVVGVASRFPGSQDYCEYWENLAKGVDSVREIPESRWDTARYYSPAADQPNKTVSKWGGLLDDVERFDCRFFGISPREAQSMDPQQRLLLEEAWRAVEDSGIPLEELQRKRTAVLVGAMTSDHLQEAVLSGGAVDGYSTLGAYHGLLANRISHCLGLRGASLAIDAGHAASLVALHQAVEALRSGDQDYALVGGVNVILSPWKYISFSKARMLSPDGRSKAFDSSANGYVPGEGAGVLVLQRLEDARKDRNTVRGVIRGTAVNHSGATVSITAPSKEAQREVILQAYQATGFGPDSVTYVEAHGTGTPLGDAAEIAALKEVFGRKGPPCLVGSVKSNIGHLEAAAGIAGVIKALLMLEHRRIPRSLHVRRVNPELALEGSCLEIATEAAEWKPAGKGNPLRCGVSGFGFGGVNAHALVEAAPPVKKAAAEKRRERVFLLSAKSAGALAALVEKWKTFAASERFARFDFADVCGTLMGRRQFGHRYGLVVRGKKALRARLIEGLPCCEPELSGDEEKRAKSKKMPDRLRLRLWLSGRDIEWRRPHGSRRVPLPVCVFEGERFRAGGLATARDAAPETTSETTGDNLAARILHDLKSVLAAKLGCRPEEIGEGDAFEGVLGVDSFTNLEILEELEKRFGTLPKTLLFEHTTVRTLAEYLTKAPQPTASVPPVRASAAVPAGEIAIVGLAGRFPQSRTVDELWRHLIRGESCIREVPAERWQIEKYFDPAGKDRDRSYTRWGGFLEHFDCFDPLFFQISPRQAEQMDPQQRIFLETAWAALEDAGYTTATLPRNTGVFAGVSGNTYGLWAAEEAARGNVQCPDTDPSDIANRASHFLDLRGPSLSVDTACSASLTALHLAVESLGRRECEAALVGGVNLTLHPNRWIQFCRKEMLLRGKDCHPFGAGAGGFVDGEGVAVVLLKPLEKALADRDHIYAVIRGTAIASEGRTSGYTVPSPERQAELIAEALRRAWVDPATISYVEAHGTGTQLGDPIEIEGLTRAFRMWTKASGFCAIGSVKSNIGHLIAAAGMAGVTKVLLQMKHGMLAPSLHAATLNPYIPFEATPFRVQQEAAEWRPAEGSPRRAGVSSFGSGGANAHVVLEEFVEAGADSAELADGAVIVPLSAKTEERLRTAAGNLLEFLEDPANSRIRLRDVAYTLQVGREAMPARAAFVGESLADLIGQLTSFCRKEPRGVVAEGELAAVGERWAAGGRVDWESLWTGARRISLPTYPFLRQRYWMPMTAPPAPAQEHATLLYRPAWREAALDQTRADDGPASLILRAQDERESERLLIERLAEGRPLRVILLADAIRPAFLLVQAIARREKAQPVDLTFGYSAGEPQLAAVESLLAAAQREIPSLTYRVVEFERGASNALEIALEESRWGQGSATIRRCEGRRWVRVMEPVERASARTAPRENGVYLITGGLGGLGLRFAEHLARQGRCRLALVGRSAAGAEAEGAIRRIEQAGAEVMALQADVSQRDEAENAVSMVKRRFGSISGVIHAAGVRRPEPLVEKSWESFAATLAPKVQGTMWLDEATRDEPLDFFAMFGSIAAWMHGDGLADYACANGFLHHFAEWREEQQRQGKRRGQTLAIGWPPWAEGGMRLSERASAILRQESGLAPLSTEAGLAAWERLRAAGVGQYLVMHGEPERIRKAMESRFPLPLLKEPAPAIVDDAQEWLRSIAAEEIGLRADEIAPETDLAAYGFDSLNMRQLIARMEERVGPLSKTLLLEYPNVRALAEHVGQHLVQQPVPAAAAQPARREAPKSAEIAIVGMSGRYPQARNLEEFWRHLQAGRQSIGPVPGERWNAEAYFDPDPARSRDGKIYAPWGAFLEDVDKFDPLLFETTPLEAKGMHPEERLLLESAWSALEDAGYTRQSMRGKQVGVWVGVNALTYPLLGLERWQEQGNAPLDASYYSLPNRISYFFDWRGPSVPVDTGCSSSLAAIHMACESIRSGACEAALASGVNLYLHRARYWMLCRDRLVSTDGDARLFKEGGNGFVPGEGVGTVLLKPLDRALADGDWIYGVVRASALAHKGRSNGFLAPSPGAQTALMRQALEQGGIDAGAVNYLEIQATGSEMADAAEWKALLEVYGAAGGKACAIGSVKPAIGHLEAASGIAQLSKVLLQMRHGRMAPTLAAENRNREIRTEGTRFYLPDAAIEWTGPRLAAITSIAAGGTAAHLVVEDYPMPARPAEEDEAELIVLSARSRGQLEEYAGSLRDHLRSGGAGERLADIAFTLQHGRTAFEHRFAAIASNRGELIERLSRFLESGLVDIGAGGGALETAAREWMEGRAVDWAKLGGGSGGRQRVPLPTYPFERRRCWIGEEAAETGVVADYYNRMTEALEKQALGVEDEIYVLFAPFAQRVEGFSWLKAFFDPAAGLKHRELMQARQKELKAVLYAGVDFGKVRLVFDIGCGLATDLMQLARQHPGLTGQGFTITPKQAELGAARIRRAGLDDRVQVYCADSTKQPFPGRYDLIVGFEVIFHIENKRAVLANIAEHLEDEGILVLADGVTNTVTEINLPSLGQFTATGPQFSRVLAECGLRIEACVDASPEIGNFLYDPRFEENLAAMNARFPELQSVEQEHRCWDSFGKALGRGLIRYLLFTIRKDRAGETADGLARINQQQIENATPYARAAASRNARADAADAGELERRVARIAGEVLEIEPERIDVEARFHDYGVGSLQGLLLLEAVNRRLGLALKMPVLYDHSSIRDLSRHIAETRPELAVAAPKAEVPQAEAPRRSNDIAVIGMSGRFAGAADVAAFWDNLKNGVDSIQEIPANRWAIDGHYDPDPLKLGRSYSKWGGFIDGVDRFDAEFFRISPREAELMDPQQRLFLEACWTALEDAGCAPDSLAGARCGVYAGVMGSDYLTLLGESGEPPEAHTLLGNDDAILASRISYFLNLKGPTLTVKTACSSSLVAVHMACRSLRDGEADLMLAGGVTLYLHPRPFEMMSRAGMLSPTGKCRPFDDQADGIAVGDGVGVVVLKRLDRALADGDRIYGVIKASGVNQDGKTNGITAPSMASQKALELEVFRAGGIAPETIGYVEAHGTGTKLGDPIEVAALCEAFREHTQQRQFCAIGSVKGNIGHTTAAAGIAGLMKMLLALEHGQIPPTLHVAQANRHIDFAGSPFFLPTELRAWERREGMPRRGSVSAFAFNGANCFLVVEEGPAAALAPWDGGACVVPLSAKNEDRLQAYARKLLEFLDSPAGARVTLAEIAYGFATGRAAVEQRLALAATDKQDLARKLAEYLRDGTTPGGLPEAAARWQAGETVDWNAVWRDARPRRVSLPAYPFAPTRYWAPRRPLREPSAAVTLLEPVWREAPLDGAGDAADHAPFSIAGEADLPSGPLPRALVYECRRGKEDIEVVARLVHGILGRRPAERVQLLLFYREEGTPGVYGAALAGFARALNQETAHLLCRTVAVPDWDAAAAIARAECGAEAAIEVSYAGGKRWIGDVAKVAPSRESNPLRQRGVYLITGGLGGIGVRLAEHLALKYQARLALCGRSEPGAEGAAAIERLGKLGTEVLYVRGDVARREEVEALVAAARRQYGRIHGIFHLAGSIRDSLMINKRWEDFAEVLAPKVDGAVNLDEACRNEELDLFALFSSVAGLAGNRGQADYAYANRFLDEFAGHREKLRAAGLRSGRTLSIGWPLWAEGGMQVAPPDREWMAAELGMEPLATGAAMAALETILESDAGPKITVFIGDAEKLLESRRRLPVAPSSPAPHPPRDRDALRAAAESLLKEVIGEHLKTPAQRIDPSVCFEDYGIDSIMINAFNARMEAAIGAFPKTLMFEYRTIGELAEYLAEHHGGQLAAIAPRAPRPAAADFKEGIAIIGMSGRYPKAANLREFWSNLEAGRDCISPVPADRWDAQAFREEIYCPYGGFLEDADRFDPLFFGISPHDAEKMDPQERIFLETAWATVEDAGYSRGRLAELRARGCETGVFVGVTSNTYLLWGAEAERQGVTAIPESMPWSIANRVSYIFDLHGPSMPVDTACSSSLSAIHLACESLRRGECGMALAGGVNLYLHPSKYVLLCQLNMLSRGGKCRSFGHGADGFVPGEGAGAVLLKPLGRALADGDPIHAVIRGSSVNHGGRTNGYTVPNPQSQADLIAAALDAGGIDPRTIGYVEGHGTGTALGDPVEIAGLTKAFRRTTGDRQFCAVGSVKSNIGHLESAAGIAGLAKVVLQMKHRRLAPSLHAERLNENIVFEDTPFYVVREAGEWKPAEGMPRRAAISSFGAGGSNAHLVVEEYCGRRGAAATASGRPQVFVLSARNADRLQAAARNVCEFVREGSAGVEEIAYTLQTGREAMAERLAVVAGDRDQLRLGLEAFLRDELPEGVYRGNEKAGAAAAGMNRAGTPGALAAAWVNGAAVDWEALYPDGKPARASLPSYPFAGKKYWIFDREAAGVAGSKVSALGPLLDRNTSSLAEVRFTKEFTGEEFYLADHVLGGWKTLPGVLSLEMARAAAEIAGERRVSRLANVVWLRPVVLDQGPATVHISLKSVPDAVEFEIYSLGSGRGERCAYTQGKVMFEEPAAPRAAVKLDLAAIRARCGTVLGAGEFYRAAAGQGFCYGPSFQAVESLWRGDGEALARLALPEAAGAAAGYGLHPALLDGALQALSAIAGRAGAAPPKIPFSLKALEIRGAVAGACYAYVAPAQYRNGGGTGDPAYDVWVLNAEGEAALVFQSLTMRAVPQEPRDEDPLLTLLKQLEAGEVRLEDVRSRLEYAT